LPPPPQIPPKSQKMSQPRSHPRHRHRPAAPSKGAHSHDAQNSPASLQRRAMLLDGWPAVQGERING
jgi:hypothetical protein